MSISPRACKTLIAVRQRREPRLRSAWQAAQEALAEGKRECDAAQAELQSRQESETRGSEAIATLLQTQFSPEAYISAGLRQQQLQAATAQAAAALQRSAAALQQLAEGVARARSLLRQNEQKIERYQVALADWKAQKELAESEQADEEAEEAATVRLLARRTLQPGCA